MKLRDLFIQIGFKFETAQLDTVTEKVTKLSNLVQDVSFTSFISKITAVRYAINALAWSVDKLISTFTTFLQSAGEQERIHIAFETILGSVTKADYLIKRLHALAVRTPFTVAEVEQNALMLNAMGFQLEELTPVMKMLGDVTAGLPNTSMERLAVTLGQVKAAAHLTGKELRTFWRSGIPMVEELAKLDKFKGKSHAEIVKMTAMRQVTSGDVLQAFKKMTTEGGRFHDMSIRLTETIPGMWSIFMDHLILFKREIGTGLQDSVKPVIKAVLKFFDENRTAIKDYIIVGLKIVFRIVREITWNIYTLLNSVRKFIEYFIKIRTLLKAILYTVMAFTVIKGLTTIYLLFVKFHGLLIALGGTLPALIKGVTASIWARLIPALKTLVVTTLPMMLWGAAILGIGLLIEDIFRYFSEGEDNVESVMGALKNSGPLGATIVGTLEAIGKIIAGVAHLLFNFDFGLLRETFDAILINLGKLFNLENFNLEKIAAYWSKVGKTLAEALSDPLLTMLDYLEKRFAGSWIGKAAGWFGGNVRGTRKVVEQIRAEERARILESTPLAHMRDKISPQLFTSQGPVPFNPITQQPVAPVIHNYVTIHGADLTTEEKLKREFNQMLYREFNTINNTLPYSNTGN